MLQEVHIFRHGETEWSLSGQHTGSTDLPLTVRGEAEAAALGARLRELRFDYVFTSPRQRARRTCELAGLAAMAKIDADLAEWDYGDYEGRRTAEILVERPGWAIVRDGAPGGETPAEISTRADRVIARLRGLEGKIAIFTHGHFGKVFAVRWIDLPVAEAGRFLLGTASSSILSYEHDNPNEPVIARWNA